MKILFVFIFCIWFMNKGKAQNLEGEWKGKSFRTILEKDGYDEIKIIFKKLRDSVFDAKSITYFNLGEGEKDSIVCRIQGHAISADQFFLEEIRVLKKIDKENFNACAQTMELTLKEIKGFAILEGLWESKGGLCEGGGKIYLLKTSD